MSLANLYIRLEIAFWDAIIPLMRQSSLVQFTLQNSYPLFKNKELTRLAMHAIFIACLGLILGFVIGFVRAHLLRV
jgi:hypothetical protein